MRFAGPRNDNFVGAEFLLLAPDVEGSFAPQHEINLIGFRMAVNPLILPGFQAIQIAEVLL